ncbi:MAG: HAMP domain-containing histidine kinase [Clostridium sp.]|nr:HAMP domain-containing histidine kinase [Clostridium sp.]
MGSRFAFFLVLLCIAAATALLYWMPAGLKWSAYVALGAALLALIILYCRIVMPSTAAARGLELIAAQDFNNFLAKVGERNADRVVALFNEIIAKLHSERLRNLEQETFLQLLVQASPMGVALLDFDGGIAMANPSFLSIMGIEAEGLAIGKKISRLSSPIAAAIDAVPLGQSRVISSGDGRMWKCYHLSFIQTGFKRRFFLLESLTEEIISAERKAYEKVIRTISHEVNNTLGGVKSVLELVSDTSPDDDLREVALSCSQRCDNLSSFIRAYADVVKLPDPVRVKTDLAAEIRKMLPFLQGIAAQKAELRFRAPDCPVYAMVDMPLLQQAIVNIVKNAVESISTAGFVDISIQNSDNAAFLEISNNGAPIPQEACNQLFTPFFTTKRSGRGLGLTLTADILRKHNASFRLRTGPDAITRFSISL